MAVDILIRIEFHMNQASKSVIRTNAKKEAVESVLCDFLRTQIGLGEDKTPANKKDIYNISIGFDLNGDNFHTISDTGNCGLTAGIVSWISQNIDSITITDFT